jgi:hypothetical protein
MVFGPKSLRPGGRVSGGNDVYASKWGMTGTTANFIAFTAMMVRYFPLESWQLLNIKLAGAICSVAGFGADTDRQKHY